MGAHLHDHVLRHCEVVAEAELLQCLEDGKTEDSTLEGTHGDPAGLEAKVHVGRAHDDAYTQPHGHRTASHLRLWVCGWWHVTLFHENYYSTRILSQKIPHTHQKLFSTRGTHATLFPEDCLLASDQRLHLAC